jgi:flagellar hook protein FlgE
MDPISTARYGMMAAERTLDDSAQRVAGMGADSSVDYAQEAVQQIGAKQAFSANAGVIKVADQMWQALLDIQEKN